MTITGNTTEPRTTPNDGQPRAVRVEDLDLTPGGLADAPASQLDRESIVHTGNS